MRGWNGNLYLAPEGVTITRGLKSIITRRKPPHRTFVPLGDITLVRFQPASLVAGYVHLVTTPSDAVPRALPSVLVDDNTVSFTRRSKAWFRLAQEVAETAGVKIESTPAAQYWRSLGELVGSLFERR